MKSVSLVTLLLFAVGVAALVVLLSPVSLVLSLALLSSSVTLPPVGAAVFLSSLSPNVDDVARSRALVAI
jgi:NADH:ubiquinone oxidoreductase subunit K